jgi:hypothetical protein
MGPIRSSRPSPAIVVAVLALVAALAGTAVGNDLVADTSALKKKKVKKIARKQVKKLAPELSVADADTVGGRPPSAFAPAAPEPFHRVGAPGQPQFQNNWHNAGPPAGAAAFYKDPWEVVRLKGLLNSGTGSDGEPAFTLPRGYRPSDILIQPVGCGGIRISPNGTVTPSCDDPSGLYSIPIDGLTFRVP